MWGGQRDHSLPQHQAFELDSVSFMGPKNSGNPGLHRVGEGSELKSW